MKLLLFVGAGGSVELGVPAMASMAESFRRHAHEWNVGPDVVNRYMVDEGADIEDLIDQLDKVCEAAPSLVGLGLDEQFVQRARSVRAEVEWFVQHACERIVPEHATIQWAPTLKASSDHDLVIATTNYDRALELAANSTAVKANDGFDHFGDNELADWIGLTSGPFTGNATLTILKLHGSTDWYEKSGSGDPVKLRHPMPLFGNSSLRVASSGEELQASLILPAREKRLTRRPYMRLWQAFFDAVDTCDAAVFVGSSLRDSHLRQAVMDCSSRKPTFVVGRNRGHEHLPSSAQFLRSSASLFVMSTLPRALVSNDLVGFLTEIAGESHSDDQSGERFLELHTAALDQSASVAARCEIIEQLEALDARLDSSFVEALVRDDEPGVARFGLGLVPSVPHSKLLLEAIETSDAQRDERFNEELDLLGSLIREG